MSLQTMLELSYAVEEKGKTLELKASLWEVCSCPETHYENGKWSAKALPLDIAQKHAASYSAINADSELQALEVLEKLIKTNNTRAE